MANTILGTTTGKVLMVSAVVGGASLVVYEFSDSGKSGDASGQYVKQDVARNDAQGDVRVKMEGLKDPSMDAATNPDAAKAAAEAAAKAAEEEAKAKEAEAAKVEEQLKAQREAEEAAALAEQQAQGEDGVAADEGQQNDGFKDENADAGDGESEAETEADEDEKGPDTYKGGNEDDDGNEGKEEQQFDENGNPIEKKNDPNNAETQPGSKVREDGQTGNNEQQNENEGKEEQQFDENGNPIVKDNDPNNAGTKVKEDGQTENNGQQNENEGKEEQQFDENGNPIEEKENEEEVVEEGNKEGNEKINKVTEGQQVQQENEETEKEGTEGPQTPGQNQQGQVSADNQAVKTEDGEYVRNTHRNNSLYTNTGGGESMADIMKAARQRWVKFFAGAAYSDGVVTMNADELKKVGAVKEGGWTEIMTGLDWAITAATDRLNSSVKTLKLDVKSVSKQEICKGIGLGIKVACKRGSLPNANAWFEIAVVGKKLNSTDIGIIKNFASMDLGGDMWEKFELEVSFDFAGKGIVRIASKQDRMKTAQQTRIQWKSKCKRADKSSGEITLSPTEARNFRVDDSQSEYSFFTNGIVWAIKEAANVSDGSRVSVLNCRPLSGENRDEVLRGIAFGISGVIRKYNEDLPNSDFTIKFPFTREDIEFMKRSGESLDGAPFEVQFGQGEVRIFKKATPETKDWQRILKEKFASGDGDVSDDAIDALKLKGVLDLALNEPKLKKLVLPGGRIEELAQALADAARRETIQNPDLVIRVFAGKDELEALESLVEELLSEGDYNYLVSVGDGTVAFGTKGDVKGAYWRTYLESWKAHEGAILKDFCTPDPRRTASGGRKEVSWESVFEIKKEDGGFEYSSKRHDYENFPRLKYFTIPLAARSGSQVEVLDLTTRPMNHAWVGPNPLLVASLIGKAFKDNKSFNGFTLKVPNADKVWEAIKKRMLWYSRYKDRIEYKGGVFILKGNENEMTTTTDTTGGMIVTVEKKDANADAGKFDEAKLEALEREFETMKPMLFESAAGQCLGGVSQCGFPIIYAYDFFNDCDIEFNGKKPGDLKFDSILITGAADPKEAGLGENDLVLKATCYYREGLYAERTVKDGEKIAETRNYYPHTWLKDCARKEGERDVLVKTSIVRPKGGLSPVSRFGGLSSVMIHDPKDLEFYPSPNNNIFRIADGASVWFISEFDPTDEAYNPKDVNQRKNLGLDSAHVSFPDGVGKRTIAIYWTFVKDGGMMGKYSKARAEAELNGKCTFPWQFSPNDNERSMKDVNEYLKAKKERKAKIETNREKRLKKAEEIARKARWDRLLGSDILTIGEDLFADKAECGDFLEKVIKKGVKTLIVKDGLGSARDGLLEFLKKIIEGEYENGIKLESLSCEDFDLYTYLKKQTSIFSRTLSKDQIVFDLIPGDMNRTLTFKKREKKEVEDEETKKRRSLFKLRQALEEEDSTIAAEDMVPYLDELGLQRVLETVFNADCSNNVNVQISFDPYLKDCEDEWVEIFRKICNRNSGLGANEVHIVGGDEKAVNGLLRFVKNSVNACASGQRFIGVSEKDLSLWGAHFKHNEKHQAERKGDAAIIAERFKDYPNQIPLAILTALGEFGNIQPEMLSGESIGKAVEKLRKKIEAKKDECGATASDGAQCIKGDEASWATDGFVCAAYVLQQFIAVVDGEAVSVYAPYHKYNYDILKTRVDGLKKSLPKSLAKRMMWIKKTTQKEGNAEDKVIYTVDFDTAEDFGEDEDVLLTFETKENKEGEVIKKWKQLIVGPNKLEYLRYSLDPEAFLDAFLSEDLEDDEEKCELKLLGISEAEPSFFDALQAKCNEEQSPRYKISIGYGFADNSKDAEMQKLVNDRFDPRAETYVVFEGKATFRYAEGDEDNENTELGRFKKFRDENPLDTFDDIEKAKRKWFESEAQRVKEEAEEAERRKKQEERQVLVDQFAAGGEVNVSQDMINALGEEGIISLGGRSYSVLDVIRKAAEAGSKVTKLSVTFGSLEQFKAALEIIIAAARKGKNADLKLEVQDIKGWWSDVEAEDRNQVDRKVQELEDAAKIRGEGGIVYDKLKIWLSGYKGGSRGKPLSVKDKVVCVDKELLKEKEEGRPGRENEDEFAGQIQKAIRDGYLSLLQASNLIEMAFEDAGTEERSLDANNVDMGELGIALNDWFSKEENRTTVPNWFLTLDGRNTAVWKAMEKVAEEINRRNGDLGNGIFMRLDRENGKILFRQTVGTDIPPLSLALGGKALFWDYDLREWWQFANIESYEKICMFAEALAELKGLEKVDFASSWGMLNPAPAALDYCRTKEGLKQLAKCSGVKFTLPVSSDDYEQLVKLAEEAGGFKKVTDENSIGLEKVSLTAENALFAKTDGSLLWNAYARDLLASTDEEKSGKFAKAIADARASGKNIDRIDFKNTFGSGDLSSVIGIGKESFWKNLNKGFTKNEDKLVLICPARNDAGWNEPNDNGEVNNFGTAVEDIIQDELKWSINGSSECITITVKKEKAMTGANPDGGAPDINTNTAGTGGGEEYEDGGGEGGAPAGEEPENEERGGAKADDRTGTDPFQDREDGEPFVGKPEGEYFESEEGIVKLTEGFQDTFQRGGCTLDGFLEGLSLYVEHQKIANPAVDLRFYTGGQWCGKTLMTFIEKIASKAEFKGWVFWFSPDVYDFFSDRNVYGHREGYSFNRYPQKKGRNSKIKVQYYVITIDK